MKNKYLAFFLLLSTLGFAQVPDTVKHLSHDFSGTLKDFAWNSPGSFIVTANTDIYRWSWKNDTNTLSIPNHSRYLKIDRLTAGNFLVLGKSSSLYGIATKIDSSGNVIWQTDLIKDNKKMNPEAFYENSDGSLIIAAGSNSHLMLAKLDANGDTSKIIIYPASSFIGITDIIKTSDGNYLGGGYLDDFAYSVKFNSNLDTFWTFTSSNFISLNQMRLMEEGSGNFKLFATNHMITISSSGSFLSDSIIAKSYMDDFISYNMDVLGVGRNKISAMPALYLYNSSGDSLDSRIHYYPGFRDGKYVKVKKLRDGTYAALGYAKDSTQLSTNVNLNFISILGASIPASIRENKTVYSIYPNPAQIFMRIEGYSDPLQLVNAKGEKVGQTLICKNGVYSIDGLSPGNYILFSEKGVYLGKIIKY